LGWAWLGGVAGVWWGCRRRADGVFWRGGGLEWTVGFRSIGVGGGEWWLLFWGLGGEGVLWCLGGAVWFGVGRGWGGGFVFGTGGRCVVMGGVL